MRITPAPADRPAAADRPARRPVRSAARRPVAAQAGAITARRSCSTTRSRPVCCGEKIRHRDGRVHLRRPGDRLASSRGSASVNGDAPDFPLKLIGMRELRSHNSWMHNCAAADAGRAHARAAHAPRRRGRGRARRRRRGRGSRRPRARSRCPVTITDEMTPGTVALPHGWGHRGGWRLANEAGGVNVNLLAPSEPESLERLAGMAHLNGIPGPGRAGRDAAREPAGRRRAGLPPDRSVPAPSRLPTRCCSTRWGRWSSSSRHGRSCEARCCGTARHRGRRRTRRARRCWPRWPTTAQHHTEGRDDSSLAELRRRCAARPARAASRAGGARRRRADRGAARVAALHALSGRGAGARGAARRSGLRPAVVSNWDCSLRQVLAASSAWRRRVDAVVVSAEVGAAKPDPAIFRAALERVRCVSGARRSSSATRSRPTSPARRARGCARCCSTAPASRGRAGVERIVSLADLLSLVTRTPTG